MANADGGEARQVTYLDAASFAPSFFPDGKRLIFSSNYGDPKGREFDLWAIDVDGSHLERITYEAGFDGFPMFSPDGTRLAFASNRNGTQQGETDIFVARWVDKPAAADPSPAPGIPGDRGGRPLRRRRALAGRRRPRGAGDRHRRPRPGAAVDRRPLRRAGGRAGRVGGVLRELRRPGGGRGAARHRAGPRRRRRGGGRLPAGLVLGLRAGGGGGGGGRLRHHGAGAGDRRLQGGRRQGEDRRPPPLRPRGGAVRGHRGRAPLRRPALQGVERPRARRQGGDLRRPARPLVLGRRAGRRDPAAGPGDRRDRRRRRRRHPRRDGEARGRGTALHGRPPRVARDRPGAEDQARRQRPRRDPRRRAGPPAGGAGGRRPLRPPGARRHRVAGARLPRDPQRGGRQRLGHRRPAGGGAPTREAGAAVCAGTST